MKNFWGIFTLLFSMPLLAQGFLPATDDIPLMQGLYSVEETASFDNPSEKMVLITAQTDKTVKEVESFYRQSLINLGWSVLDGNNYFRGLDILKMEFSSNSVPVTVQFTLIQKNESFL